MNSHPRNEQFRPQTGLGRQSGSTSSLLTRQWPDYMGKIGEPVQLKKDVLERFRKITQMANWFYLLVGAVLIITGLTAKSLINEAEIPATEEERQNAKPTWKGRLLVVAAGILSCVYGVFEIVRHN